MARFFSRVASLLRNTAHRGEIEEELSEELNSYLELLTERNMKSGMTEEEARRAAQVEIAGVEQLKERVREARAGFGIETFMRDLRYGLRTLLKKPGFTLTAVIALALGIGANTAIFSVINGVLLRTLPYGEPGRIAMLWERNASLKSDKNVVSPANFLEWQKQSHSFSQMAAVADYPANLTGGGGEPEEIKAQFVSCDFFSTLGVQPVLGRTFTANEDRKGDDLVIVLSHQLWRNRFGADPAVLGKQATINGRQRTIIGVMPPGFHFLDPEVKAWMPLALNPAMNYWQVSGRYLRAVGRLKAGVSLQQAQAELTGISKQLEQAYPKYNTGWSVNLVPIHEQITGEIRPILLLLLAAVVFVLLIACANVANLLLSRAAGRQKEFALRAALGAGRMRLVRQMLTESVLLAMIGGVVGVVLAFWGVNWLLAFGPDIPRLSEIGIDLRVLAFTLAISVTTGVLFGLIPALQASRPDLNDALKEGSRGSTCGRSRILRNVFVIAEVSLALVLLIGAGLMIRSLIRLQAVETGFKAENVLTMRLELPVKKYPKPQQVVAFYKQAQERIAALPGVQAIGAISYLPLTGLASRDGFRIVGQPAPAPGEEPGVEVRIITPGYFRAMGIPLLKGRLLNERDGAEPRVLLINETMAKRYFANQDPLGKRIIVTWDGSGRQDEIVGVVGDIRESALEKEAEPAIYWPLPREANGGMALVIRGAGDTTALTTAVEKAIRGLDPDLPVADVRTMQQVISSSIARPRFNTMLFAIFAGVALVLAAVGLYGVMNYSATQRIHEIGIRMALGATRADIMRLVVGHGMVLTLIGIGVGVAASYGLTRVMQAFLFGVGATDAATFISVSALLIIVALVANYIPAHRATRVNPVIALRYE
jgi:putative ABC transport system permease protein